MLLLCIEKNGGGTSSGLLHSRRAESLRGNYVVCVKAPAVILFEHLSGELVREGGKS